MNFVQKLSCLTISLGVAYSILVPQAARADLEVCNESGKLAYVATAFKQSRSWVSQGWDQIRHGRCKTVMTGNMRTNSVYVYIADDNWNPYILKQYGTINDSFCLKQSAFRIVDADSRCRGNMMKKTFQLVDSNAYNFKITLD